MTISDKLLGWLCLAGAVLLLWLLHRMRARRNPPRDTGFPSTWPPSQGKSTTSTTTKNARTGSMHDG